MQQIESELKHRSILKHLCPAVQLLISLHPARMALSPSEGTSSAQVVQECRCVGGKQSVNARDPVGKKKL